MQIHLATLDVIMKVVAEGLYKINGLIADLSFFKMSWEQDYRAVTIKQNERVMYHYAVPNVT